MGIVRIVCFSLRSSSVLGMASKRHYVLRALPMANANAAMLEMRITINTTITSSHHLKYLSEININSVKEYNQF